MRSNSKPHEDLVYEISQGSSHDAFAALIAGIADRIEAARLNPVKISDLVSILREDTTKLYKAVMRKG
ncbi:hypothetical protein [Bradyrhizobium ottawaense]|uniref:CRISPR/Cas system-associated exonuclease Cas4 (RecB family) n=1 Tax=Bradyrhizobium ottawaense TaxID=931866 RepID=A0ABV4G275_9BRAD